MTNIVSVTPGNYTPGAQTALDFAAAVINAAWDQANTKNTAFETKVAGVDAMLAATPVANITADIAGTTAVIEPVVTIPATVSTTDVMSVFDTKYLELVALLSDKFTTFRATYFPNEGTTYTAAEGWLAAALANPDQAIPSAVAAQILADDKARAYAEASATSDAVLATFASRRFPLPPGAAAGAVLQAQQKAQDVVADSSRKLVMNYVEQMKFAVEKAVNLRAQAMGDAVAYIKALASGPDMASRIVSTGYDAQSKLISSVSQFYGARSEAQRVVNQAEQFNVTTKLAKDEKNQSVALAVVEERVKALIGEAQALAQMAASMYNNLHANAGTSYNVSS